MGNNIFKFSPARLKKAQDKLRKKEVFKVKDNNTFKVGDTVLVIDSPWNIDLFKIGTIVFKDPDNDKYVLDNQNMLVADYFSSEQLRHSNGELPYDYDEREKIINQHSTFSIHLDKYELAKYIMYRYHKEKGYTASPIRLHKTMYLMFGLWASTARQIRQQKHYSKVAECGCMIWFDKLFEPRFILGGIGAFDADIKQVFEELSKDYKSKDNILNEESTYGGAEPCSVIVNFVDDIIDQTFDITDIDLMYEVINMSKSLVSEVGEKIPTSKIIDEFIEKYK